ncbi:MAG: RAD55 family ATPase [Halobacteriaceae archaeon]
MAQAGKRCHQNQDPSRRASGMVDRVETGVEGLDSILNGGIAEHASVLVSGNPGTGKSILSMQYIHHGVTEHDEKGIYLSFEENEADIRAAAESIGLEGWGDRVDEGDIVVYDKRDLLSEEDFSSTIDRILEYVANDAYSRLVMDSLTMFEMFFESERDRRTYLLRFIDILKEHGQTALLINEQGAIFPETEVDLENFLTDGNIYLAQIPTNADVNRYLWVAKMRKQDFDNEVFPMDIGQGGVSVHSDAAGFSLMEGSDPEDTPFGP